MSTRKKAHSRQCKAYGAAIKRKQRQKPQSGDDAVLALGRQCSASHRGTAREPIPREATMSAPVAPPAPKTPKAKVSARKSVDKPATPPPASGPTVLGALARTTRWFIATAMMVIPVAAAIFLGTPTWQYLIPGEYRGYTYGFGMAAGIVLAGIGVGHIADERRRAGQRFGYLVAVVVGFGLLDGIVANLREDVAVHTEVTQGLQGAQTTLSVPPELVGHPQSIEAWARSQERLSEGKTGALVKHAYDRSIWERPALIGGAVLLSLAVSFGGAALTELVYAFFGIFEAMLAKLRRDPKPAAAPTLAPEPDMVSAPREGFWTRLSRKLPYGPFKPRQTAS